MKTKLKKVHTVAFWFSIVALYRNLLTCRSELDYRTLLRVLPHGKTTLSLLFFLLSPSFLWSGIECLLFRIPDTQHSTQFFRFSSLFALQPIPVLELLHLCARLYILISKLHKWKLQHVFLRFVWRIKEIGGALANSFEAIGKWLS